MRVHEHPILGNLSNVPLVRITVDGRPVPARSGEPIWAALMAAGIVVAHHTDRLREPRGAFCGIGRCTDCAMTVDGVPNVRTCVTPVREGMAVETYSRSKQ